MEQGSSGNASDPTGKRSDKEKRVQRRDILKGLATLPVLGGFIYGLFKKKSLDHKRKKAILAELGIGESAPAVLPKTTMKNSGQLIRLGIIGFGVRGEQLARAAGFAHPEWIEERKRAAQQAAKEGQINRGLEDWFNQDNLNVAITGICDVFDMRAEKGIETSKNDFGPGSGSGPLPGAKRFRNYQDMLQSNEVDAVMISTPDHLHAQITIDAVKSGKHVYCEKCMTRTEEEVYRVVDTVKKGHVVFQLGHQYPQTAAYFKAKEIVDKNILGKITLVETTSNRNTPHGAWIRHLDAKGNPRPGGPDSIDWKQWLGSRPKVPFSIERYYNWTLWWDYATGLSGQLLGHEYDAVNQLLHMGIPKSVVASGGIYFYKDVREIPDVYHVVFEYPDHDLTVIYSASLASSRSRGKVFMGHDASMEVGGTLTVKVDRDSTRFMKKLQSGIIDPELPLFSYRPGSKDIDVVTSATENYYASRGLIFTYQDGKRIDVTHLHVKEWLDCIRNGGKPSCDIDKGFEVTIACHMATKSFREKRRVEWDPVKNRIV